MNFFSGSKKFFKHKTTLTNILFQDISIKIFRWVKNFTSTTDVIIIGITLKIPYVAVNLTLSKSLSDERELTVDRKI